jgi:parallel beta-helix repeat protein
MRKIIAFALIFALCPAVLAECEAAFDLMQITKDTYLCNKAFDVPSGITIKTDNVTLDCNGAIIRGTAMQDGQGIIIDGADGVTVKNCNILNYNVGIYVKEANRNTIVQNALLKNQIGVRMYQAFENRFESNADKSILKPVSALVSKFNTFQITNKELDKDFCDVNMCNEQGFINPCEDGDVYCSPSCNYETDNDCPQPEAPVVEEQKPVELLPEEKPAMPESPAPVMLNLTTQSAVQTTQMATGKFAISFMGQLSEKARFWTMAVLFIISYLIGFICYQHHHYKHG